MVDIALFESKSICCQKRPRYYHISLGQRIGPLILLRSKKGELKVYDLKK